MNRVEEDKCPVAILWNPLSFSYTSICFLSMSGTESLPQSNTLKKLLKKNSAEHDNSHSVWKVTKNRSSPVWHLLSFGIIPEPIAFSPA